MCSARTDSTFFEPELKISLLIQSHNIDLCVAISSGFCLFGAFHPVSGTILLITYLVLIYWLMMIDWLIWLIDDWCCHIFGYAKNPENARRIMLKYYLNVRNIIVVCSFPKEVNCWGAWGMGTKSAEIVLSGHTNDVNSCDFSASGLLVTSSR